MIPCAEHTRILVYDALVPRTTEFLKECFRLISALQNHVPDGRVYLAGGYSEASPLNRAAATWLCWLASHACISTQQEPQWTGDSDHLYNWAWSGPSTCLGQVHKRMKAVSLRSILTSRTPVSSKLRSICYTTRPSPSICFE